VGRHRRDGKTADSGLRLTPNRVVYQADGRRSTARLMRSAEVITIPDKNLMVNPLLAYRIVSYYLENPTQRINITSATVGGREW
jgi:hypothetical protein